MPSKGRSRLEGLPQRALWLLALAALCSLGLFALLHALPGDPVSRLMFQEASAAPEEAERLRRLQGLDQPILVRYRCWLLGAGEGSESDARCAAWPTRGLLRGDLGRSRQHKLPVTELLAPRLFVSLSIMAPGLALGLMAGIVFGLLAAKRRGFFDLLVRSLGVLGLATPMHWLGLVLIYLLSLRLGWLPSGGRGDGFGGRVVHAVLPVLVLGVFYFARLSRFVRGAALAAARARFVEVLRSRGVSESRIWRVHVLPHALLPLVAVVGQAIPGLISGSLIVERVFSLPGMGVLFFESLENDDPMVAMAVGMLVLLVSFAATSAVELVYYAVDPRTRAAISEGKVS